MVPTFNGAEVYTEKDKLHKVSFDDILKNKTSYPKNAADGWIAIVQHYFLGAWLPTTGVSREYSLRPLENGLFAAGVILPVGRVEAGQTSGHRLTLLRAAGASAPHDFGAVSLINCRL